MMDSELFRKLNANNTEISRVCFTEGSKDYTTYNKINSLNRKFKSTENNLFSLEKYMQSKNDAKDEIRDENSNKIFSSNISNISNYSSEKNKCNIAYSQGKDSNAKNTTKSYFKKKTSSMNLISSTNEKKINQVFNLNISKLRGRKIEKFEKPLCLTTREKDSREFIFNNLNYSKNFSDSFSDDNFLKLENDKLEV
jgi:hypothetical protein